MDSYTIAILGILILAIQGLGLHSILILYGNEGELRQTLANQGKELIRLRSELKQLGEQQQSDPSQLDALQQDQPLGIKNEPEQVLDNEETLEDLIARYEMDETNAWQAEQDRNPTALN